MVYNAIFILLLKTLKKLAEGDFFSGSDARTEEKKTIKKSISDFQDHKNRNQLQCNIKINSAQDRIRTEYNVMSNSRLIHLIGLSADT